MNRHKSGPARPIHFRQWRRKSYAVFASLGRLIRIGVLRVSMVLRSLLVQQAGRMIRVVLYGCVAQRTCESVCPADPCSEEPGAYGVALTNSLAVFPPAPEESQVHRAPCRFPSREYDHVQNARRSTGPKRGACDPLRAPHFRGMFTASFCNSRFLAGQLLMTWISGLAVILYLTCRPYVARAQSDTTILLQELVISENRLSIPFRESSRNISVVDRQMMRRAPVQSLPEVLSYVPGVDIRQRGPLGVQADISIRGGTFEQTLVMVNGIKLTDPQTGHHLLNVPLHFDNLERVEVLKGGGARIFGQNAFAGAVNFITVVPEQRRLSVRGYGGSFGSSGLAASVALPSGSYGHYLGLAYDASDGYRHNTDYSIANMFYQSEFQALEGDFSLIAGMSDRSFGANGFYASPAFTEQYEAVRTGMLSLGYSRRSGPLLIQPRVYYRYNRDKYQFVRSDPGRYQNLHTTNVLAAELNMSYENALGVTGMGVEWRGESIAGDWLRGGQPSKSNLDGFSRGNAGMFLEHRFRLFSRLDLIPGIYTNWSTDFGFAAFPGIDLGYNLYQKVRLYANVGKSYRIPTFYDQNYQSPVESGNPELLPEEAWAWEGGLRYLGSAAMAEVNYFQRDARQLIDWVYDPSDSIWRARNFSSVMARGVEMSFGLDLHKLVQAQLPEIRFHGSYNFTELTLAKEEELRSRYALDNIRHQFIFGVDHELFLKLRNSFRVRYIDRLEQAPYWLVDNRLSWVQSELWSAYIEATNLTDQSYTEVMTVMPGRWIRMGLNLTIPMPDK